MGVVSSKSPLERRNTVLRRSQRKSIHGVKSKAEKLAKDIRKFKGIEENSDYIELKARIETAERDLRAQSKNLQPQIRNIYNEALKKTEECNKLLENQLKENQEKIKEVQAKEQAKQVAKEKKDEREEEKDDDDDDDDVFVEEMNEESQETAEKRKTVELKVIQVEPIEASPQINKRLSAMKVGVPVLPGSMLESIHRKAEESNFRNEQKVASIHREIEALETEISQFVGRKNGKYYNKIKGQLESYYTVLQGIFSTDDDILEKKNLCNKYIQSCISFLDEKAVDGDVDDDDDDDDDYDEVPTENTSDVVVAESNLSPRSIRTTYI